MKATEFLDVVPRSFKNAAWAVAACFVVGGIVVAGMQAIHPAQTTHHAALPALVLAQGSAIGMLGAVFVSTWILCLGYVHADARRRAMPAWLWTLVSAFIPNLLGFLLYFACRRAIAVPCPHCNQANAPGQRFCSWCGQPASGPLASGGVLA